MLPLVVVHLSHPVLNPSDRASVDRPARRPLIESCCFSVLSAQKRIMARRFTGVDPRAATATVAREAEEPAQPTMNHNRGGRL